MIPKEKLSGNYNLIIYSFILCKLLRNYTRKYNPDRIVLIELMSFLPFVCLPLYGKSKIIGIIYRIYLYEWSELSIIKKITEVIKYLLMKYSKNIFSVKLLNDSVSPRYLNSLYHTNKFQYITDPFPQSSVNIYNIREKYAIGNDKTIFAHVGALGSRKGTLDILDSINYIPASKLETMAFIFGGRLENESASLCRMKYKEMSSKCQIIFVDRFLTSSEINSILSGCDVILIPYRNTSQSSGIISYASKYHKPVVGPKKGLLGKLIKKFKLGVVVEEINPEGLAISYTQHTPPPSSEYVDNHSVSHFVKDLFEYV